MTWLDLGNDTRYSYGMRIAGRTQTFEWYIVSEHLYNSNFKVAILFNRKTIQKLRRQDRLIVSPSYMIYWMATFSMTLKFQDHAILTLNISEAYGYNFTIWGRACGCRCVWEKQWRGWGVRTLEMADKSVSCHWLVGTSNRLADQKKIKTKRSYDDGDNDVASNANGREVSELPCTSWDVRENDCTVANKLHIVLRDTGIDVPLLTENTVYISGGQSPWST